MINEPNSHNHHQQQQPADLEGLESVDSALLPEVEALTRRLAADGAVWQSHLPDAARVAQRIRTIPHESPDESASEGGFLMFDDTGSAPELRRPLPPPPHSRPASLWQRLGSLAAVAVVLVLVGSMALVFYAVRHTNGGGATSAQPTSTAISVPVVLKVTSVTMAITPASITGLACGTNMTETYIATIHVTPKGPGGSVQFSYTVNNGRGQTMASVTFSPGETTKTYKFTWSGALPADHTAPGLGGIQVTSPNQLTSPLIAPTGLCAPVTPPACGSNFSSPGSQSYQSTLTTAYGTVPLPSLSRTVPNDAAGGVRGYDICSAGTTASITAFMQQNLPTYGWTLVSNSGGIESWKSSTGTINWSVSDPLEWNINWRVPLS